MASLIKCKDCGHSVSKNAQSCPSCGAPIKKKPTSLGCGTLIVVVVLGYFLWSVMQPTYDSPTPTQNVSAPAQQPIAPVTSGNVAHNALMQLSEAERARSLGRIVDGGESSCRDARRSFFQGFDQEKAAYWNVTCADGAKYNVQIAADAGGSTIVLDCGVLAAVAGVECYTRFED